MKFNNIRAFIKHLQDASKQKHFADCYLLMAEDALEKREALAQALKYLLLDETSKELATEQFSGGNGQVEAALSSLQTMSLVAKNKVVVLHGVESLSKSSLEKLEKGLNRRIPSAILIATAEGLNRGTTLYKKFESLGVILDVAEEKPWEKEKSREEWALSRAAFYGKKMQPKTAKLLVKLVGTSYESLNQELLKLSTFAIDREEITEADLSKLIAPIPEQNVWLLGEAIFIRDTKKAVLTFKDLLKEGNALLSLLAMLRKQFETGFEIASILAKGGGLNEVSAAFPYMKGQILEKNAYQAKNFGLSRYKNGLLAIDEATLKAKNSQIDADLLADLLLFKLLI